MQPERSYDNVGMVSRIRVETRGGSMEAAERVAFLILDHARMAGLLEGVVPESGEYTDHFFNRPIVTRKFGEGPEPWTELGLHYAGRLTFAFEPMVAQGGIKQFGHIVLNRRQAEPFDDSAEGGWERVTEDDLPKLEEVTESVIVLQRQNEVTREHTWEGLSRAITVPSLGEASAEDVLDNIRRLSNVNEVKVNVTGGPDEESIFVVRAYDLDGNNIATGAEHDLRAAALTCYGSCGVEVTHYDTVAPDSEAPFEVTMHIANLNVPVVMEALSQRPYRTLIVGSNDALHMVNEVMAMIDRDRANHRPENVVSQATQDAWDHARDLSARWDTSHDRDKWTLTTAVIEP